MTYTALCMVKDIEAWFVNKKFTSETTPSFTQVGSWINEATSFIYSAVAEQYVVPVHPDDLLVLKGLCSEYVRDNVNFLYGGNKVTLVEKGISVPRQLKHDSFWKKLEQIKLGELKLIHSTPARAGVYVRSSNVEEGVEAVSKKDDIQW